MKVIASLLMICITAVLAEDVYFYDHAGGELIHRLDNKCYIMMLTPEQQTRPQDLDNFKQMMRDLATDPAHTSELSTALASDYANEHCPNRELFLLTQ